MKILVTAGPTREALDPVRFLSNRSTGRMGYAIADVAKRRGHEVRLISGPVAIEVPAGLEVSRVVSAAEMCDAVLASLAPWRLKQPVIIDTDCESFPPVRHSRPIPPAARAYTAPGQVVVDQPLEFLPGCAP